MDHCALGQSYKQANMQNVQTRLFVAEYPQCTADVCQVLKWTFSGRSCLDDRVLSRGKARALQEENSGERDLIESVSDSDWAGHHDRVSSLRTRLSQWKSSF